MGTAREYQIQPGKGFSVITFESCLSDSKWGDIERVGTELKTELSGQTRPYCLLDLSKLEFMGSSIVALLVRVWKTVQEQQGGMVVLNPNTMTKEVLEIAGLAKVWTICKSRPEAEEALAKVLPADTKTPGVLAAIIGWTMAGAVLALLLAQNNQLLDIPGHAVRVMAYLGCGFSAVANFIAVLKGGGAWRFFGVIGVILAICQIAAILNNVL